MKELSRKFDQNLAYLAWSLWTELGVLGLERKHQSFSIAPEELILLTAVLSEFDPRLRDEALDWCSRYHRYISTTRLRNLVRGYQRYSGDAFSLFAATLNELAHTNWPLTVRKQPLKITLSGKSVIRDFELPAMVHFRLRALFGVSARADVLAFFLTEEPSNFSTAEVTQIGYTKRHLAEVLHDFTTTGIFQMKRVGNQMRYTWAKREKITDLLGSLPRQMVPWYRILEVLLPIRDCIHRVENKSIGTKVVEIRNLLMQLDESISRLNLTAPSMQEDLEAYWDDFANWILSFTKSLSLFS